MIRLVFRFLGVTVFAAAAVSLIGRCFSDFDLPAEEDPHDLLRGVGVWVVAVLVAVLDQLRLRMRRRGGK